MVVGAIISVALHGLVVLLVAAGLHEGVTLSHCLMSIRHQLALTQLLHVDRHVNQLTHDILHLSVFRFTRSLMPAFIGARSLKRVCFFDVMLPRGPVQ